MRKFSITTEIAAPAQRVWEVMRDVERWHEWTPSVTSIRRLDEGPLGVGSRLVIRQPKFPPAWWKVISVEPGRGFISASKAPGLRVVAHHFVEPTPAGSRATLSLDFQGLLGGVWGRWTKDINDRYLAFEAKGLKARSEDPSYRYQNTP
jgi:uncharacterized membrane protein